MPARKKILETEEVRGNKHMKYSKKYSGYMFYIRRNPAQYHMK